LNALYARIEERLRALPGVSSVAAAAAPLGRPFYRTPALFPGNRKGFAGWNSVGDSLFETMRIPILLGRPFNPHDAKGAPSVAVVNQAFARKYFPDRTPIGEHMGILDGAKDVTIVGVVANSRESLREPFSPFIFLSYRQFPAPEWRGMVFAVRTSREPHSLGTGVRRTVHEVAPDVPLGNMITQAERIENSLAKERTFAHLCTAFAIVALTIGGIGMYGSMAYAVSRRTKEIGIRMAMGARGGRVIWMVLREVLLLTCVGLAAGIACARVALSAIESYLFRIRFGDSSVVGWSVALLIAGSVMAAYGPARKASRIDPVEALRHE
jgi:predicted permease